MNDVQDRYIVSLDRFEGPLDLLYQLIERRKLQINTISLSKVTADFIAYMRGTSALNADEIARFVHTASLLILIKSKSLLPILEYTKEEESDVAVLEERMRLFSYVRERTVPALDGWRKVSFSVRPPSREPVFSPDSSCTVEGIERNARSAVSGLSFLKEPPGKRVEKTVRIEEIIERVLSAVTERVSVSFGDLARSSDKRETIVSFLAVLELVRNNLLMATQCAQFDDIVLSKGETS